MNIKDKLAQEIVDGRVASPLFHYFMVDNSQLKGDYQELGLSLRSLSNIPFATRWDTLYRPGQPSSIKRQQLDLKIKKSFSDKDLLVLEERVELNVIRDHDDIGGVSYTVTTNPRRGEVVKVEREEYIGRTEEHTYLTVSFENSLKGKVNYSRGIIKMGLPSTTSAVIDREMARIRQNPGELRSPSEKDLQEFQEGVNAINVYFKHLTKQEGIPNYQWN